MTVIYHPSIPLLLGPVAVVSFLEVALGFPLLGDRVWRHRTMESVLWTWWPGGRAHGQVWVQIVALASLLCGFGLKTWPVLALVSHSGEWDVSPALAG